MSNQTYDRLKWAAQIALPAFGTLCWVLSSIWGLPYGEQVVGTVTAVDAFLGALLGLSSAEYQKRKPDADGSVLREVRMEKAARHDES